MWILQYLWTFALITTDMFHHSKPKTQTLQLTNFLNILSVSSIAVTVSATLIVPFVTLASPAAIYRSLASPAEWFYLARQLLITEILAVTNLMI